MMNLFEQRNIDFLQAVDDVRSCALADGVSLSVREAVRRALRCRPRGFYLSFDYASRKLAALRRCGSGVGGRRSDSRRLWDELVAAVDDRRACNPREDDIQALDFVLDHCCPSRFYISEVYAEKLYYALLRGRRRVVCLLPSGGVHRRRRSRSLRG